MVELSVIYSSHNASEIILIGYMNTDPNKGQIITKLSSFAGDNCLYITDVFELPRDPYTYISPSESCHTSWFDHVLTNKLNFVNNHRILYGHAFSDHLLLYVELRVPSGVVFEI